MWGSGGLLGVVRGLGGRGRTVLGLGSVCFGVGEWGFWWCGFVV